jgi:crotonobetainyl-CoA:carnitine CoA-transferase CaiB-like acyl-CoA transferase
VLLRLAESTDVVVENYRAGVMERNGLSFERLRARNRRLVYAAIRGFGDARTGESPYVDWPAYDVVAQAMGGIMGITGPDRETPLKVGPGVGDIVPAMMAAFGILAAVLRARETGEGQYVDVGMADCVLSLCERILHQYSYEGKVPRPEGNRHPLLAPFGMVPAKDGWVTIACHRDPFWAELCRLMEAPQFIDDSRFATMAARLENASAVYDTVSAFTRLHTKRELMDRFGGRIPFGPVWDVSEIAADPHYRVRGMVAEVEHPGLASPMRVAGVPVRMTETPGGVHRRAPLLGEHAEEILAGIGLSEGEIAAMRESKVIV